jgi:hypothetical protein
MIIEITNVSPMHADGITPAWGYSENPVIYEIGKEACANTPFFIPLKTNEFSNGAFSHYPYKAVCTGGGAAANPYTVNDGGTLCTGGASPGMYTEAEVPTIQNLFVDLDQCIGCVFSLESCTLPTGLLFNVDTGAITTDPSTKGATTQTASLDCDIKLTTSGGSSTVSLKLQGKTKEGDSSENLN